MENGLLMKYKHVLKDTTHTALKIVMDLSLQVSTGEDDFRVNISGHLQALKAELKLVNEEGSPRLLLHKVLQRLRCLSPLIALSS